MGRPGGFAEARRQLEDDDASLPSEELTTAGVRLTCEVCGSTTDRVGQKSGKTSGRVYEIRQCPNCWFTMVANPWTEFEKIYSEDYYLGRGADPLIHYLDEIEQSHRTIRRYEWSGVLAWAGSVTPIAPSSRWLDYGCGTGGLVKFLAEHGMPLAEGFEHGWAASRLEEAGIAHVDADELAARANSYDIVSMIEVIEHVVDPVAELRRVRELLAPGGVLLLTTGNARRYRANIVRWRYLVPDIHVSLFEPSTLALAFSRAGLIVEQTRFSPGWEEIIRFKLLKSARRQYVQRAERLVPWHLATRLADRRWGFSGHPVGRAPLEGSS